MHDLRRSGAWVPCDSWGQQLEHLPDDALWTQFPDLVLVQLFEQVQAM